MLLFYAVFIICYTLTALSRIGFTGLSVGSFALLWFDNLFANDENFILSDVASGC